MLLELVVEIQKLSESQKKSLVPWLIYFSASLMETSLACSNATDCCKAAFRREFRQAYYADGTS